MKGFWLTDINSVKKPNELIQSNEEKKDEDFNQGAKSAFLIKNTKEFEETTSNLLNYMVEEQTDFADLMKIEQYLKSQTIEYCEEFNLNKHDLTSKNDYLKKISLEIEEVKNLILNIFRNY